jgi:hypothetical protein
MKWKLNCYVACAKKEKKSAFMLANLILVDSDGTSVWHDN